MNQNTIIAAVVVLILIIGGMFWFAQVNKTTEVENNEPVDTSPEETRDNTDDPYSTITRITAKHFFIDGTHTLTGEILMPTACDLLDWDVSVAESFPEQVTVDFRVINNADTCAQVVTPQRFSVSFDASEQAIINARLNGRPLELNLVPAGPDETPEDFELFIKG